MLKRLSHVSWAAIIALAMAWPLVWLLIAAGTIVAFSGSATSGSGGLAAIGFSVTTPLALLLLGPPALLVILRAIASYIGSR